MRGIRSEVDAYGTPLPSLREKLHKQMQHLLYFCRTKRKKALDFTESPMPFYVWHHVQNLTYLLGILLLGQGVCIDGAPEDHKSVIEILQKEIGGHIQGCYQILIPPQSIR